MKMFEQHKRPALTSAECRADEAGFIVGGTRFGEEDARHYVRMTSAWTLRKPAPGFVFGTLRLDPPCRTTMCRTPSPRRAKPCAGGPRRCVSVATFAGEASFGFAPRSGFDL